MARHRGSRHPSVVPALVALTSAVLGLLVCGLTADANAASSSGSQRVVRSIVVSPTYAADHTLFASAVKPTCASCVSLLMSSDGGTSWRPRTSKGWVGGNLSAVRLGTGSLLASASDATIQVSPNGGASWRTLAGSGGSLTVARDGSAASLFIGGKEPREVTWPGGATRPLPTVGLESPAYFPVRDARHPDRIGFILIAGLNRQTNQPMLARCTVSMRCGTPRAISQRTYGAVLFASPNMARDDVAYALVGQGQPLRTDNGGRTFADDAVPPVPAPGTTAASGVSSIMFSPDYDRKRGDGYSVAAVYDVQSAIHAGKTSFTTVSGFAVSAAGSGAWSYLRGAVWSNSVITAAAVTPDGRLVYATSAAGGAGALSCGQVSKGALFRCSAASQAASHSRPMHATHGTDGARSTTTAPRPGGAAAAAPSGAHVAPSTGPVQAAADRTSGSSHNATGGTTIGLVVLAGGAGVALLAWRLRVRRSR